MPKLGRLEGPKLDVGFLKSVNKVLELGITDERLREVSKNVNVNWRFYEFMNRVRLDKRHDPNAFLALVALMGDMPE